MQVADLRSAESMRPISGMKVRVLDCIKCGSPSQRGTQRWVQGRIERAVGVGRRKSGRCSHAEGHEVLFRELNKDLWDDHVGLEWGGVDGQGLEEGRHRVVRPAPRINLAICLAGIRRGAVRGTGARGHPAPRTAFESPACTPLCSPLPSSCAEERLLLCRGEASPLPLLFNAPLETRSTPLSAPQTRPKQLASE